MKLCRFFYFLRRAVRIKPHFLQCNIVLKPTTTDGMNLDELCRLVRFCPVGVCVSYALSGSSYDIY